MQVAGWGLGTQRNIQVTGWYRGSNSTILGSRLSEEIVSSPHVWQATGTIWGISSTVTGDEKADGWICRLTNYQTSSLFKRSQGRLDMQKSPTKDQAVAFLMLHTRFIRRLNSVELSAWTGLKLILQRMYKGIYRVALLLAALGRKSSANCINASIATEEVIQPPCTSPLCAFHPSFCC